MTRTYEVPVKIARKLAACFPAQETRDMLAKEIADAGRNGTIVFQANDSFAFIQLMGAAMNADVMLSNYKVQ